MAKVVSWRWVCGYRCPDCGGPVLWVTAEKMDVHTPTGFATIKKPITHVVSRPVCTADAAFEETVSAKGHEVLTRTRYKRVLDVECRRCNCLMNSSELVAGEPDEYPPGYFVEE